MLNLEMAIQKIREFTPDQQNQVISFIQLLELKSNQQHKNNATAINSNQEQDFFEIAGIWENKDITTESLRLKAWSRDSQ
ncbi:MULTISPECIES: hypothetical protein [Planktothricoides]|uniref:DUF2281 domain-containing protein n=1 Tax=Planktothricoides raciborskii FACHB-1370 TaxID=2949576 RepID=A0ABR8ENV1_9CYAN|nr:MULTISPECIES: hypothetical protein [Planktothricoides]KOR38579.1 hypothetical protein AM228_01015 [Planktothricoides sp. SR001]MBD2547575.1 DUF2281 domain-containing protein [Planktothricoides raciborskii FACHB-1370]MBD2586051.1 DUF2281 domain-containing protein [Planktothricoides raciborskii FACHB-1261]